MAQGVADNDGIIFGAYAYDVWIVQLFTDAFANINRRYPNGITLKDFNQEIQKEIDGRPNKKGDGKLTSSLWSKSIGQTARQLALYYPPEKNNEFVKFKFDHKLTPKEAEDYLYNWIWHYYVPNPFTKESSFKHLTHPILLVESIIEYLEKNEEPQNIIDVCKKVFKSEKISDDSGTIGSIRQILELAKVFNFSETKLEKGRATKNQIELNENYLDTMSSLNFINRKDKAAFFNQTAAPSAPGTPMKFEAIKETNMLRYLAALHTKPFIILSGISGTGKSRKVRELAYKTCPKPVNGNEQSELPKNYCLIEVKPNWHDSTELLGYYSSINQKYVITKFIEFIYRAAKDPNIPYFFCLDEMNLAPVEQYLAEFLSVIETRRLAEGKIISDPLITPSQVRYTAESELDKDDIIRKYIAENGLYLPENLFFIGTVNVDDTTHQLSRKVIDRAFTIEMNGGNIESLFNEKEKLHYEDNANRMALSQIKPNFTEALDAYNKINSEESKVADAIKEKVPMLMNRLDYILGNTPFKVSYRVANELVLYIDALRDLTKDSEYDIDSIITESFFSILLEKVLPRIAGDKSLKEPLSALLYLVNHGFAVEKKMDSDSNQEINNPVIDIEKFGSYINNSAGNENKYTELKDTKELLTSKIEMMLGRLNTGYFTSFFS